ncbi:MAG: CDP-diacylglycerol--serine O-phosphatidyltransferase [Bacteroidales bacterium]|nr:CDP-diacylglycerol--serine O-phosphatidyltransferase [Bacteroidales bacterium]
MLKKQIPNCITAFNLLGGLFAIVAGFENALLWAGFFIALGAFFDFFDGMAARLLQVKSNMGKEMDSLADMVTFGVAPGFIVYHLMLQSTHLPQWIVFNHAVAPFVAFVIPVFAAFRLAKFNIDTRQTSSFIGLPSPANALFFASLPFILSATYAVKIPFLQDNLSNYWVLFTLVLLISLLMVIELPLFALKFNNLKWKDNTYRFVFLGLAAGILIAMQITALPIIVFLYIVLSIIQNLLTKNK